MKIITRFVLLFFFMSFCSQAQDTLKREWDGLHLIKNKKNSVIQDLAIVGRYHGQFWNVNADQGDAKGWDNRRFFIGAEAVLFQHFTAHVQIKIGEDFESLYNGMYQAYLKWRPNKGFTLTIGRIDFLYAGLERTVSSNKIMTFERSLISNQLWPGEVVGAVVEGKFREISYHAGLLGGAKGDDIKEADYKRGRSLVTGVGFNAPLFYKTGSLHLDYLYNNGKSTIDGFEPYRHSLSLWHQGQIGPFSLGIELTAAKGLEGVKSVMGINLLPSYVVAKNLLRKGDAMEAAVRYQYASSDGNNGLSLQSRYERKVSTSSTGNSYQALYAGMNYLLVNNRLKMMTGVEYSSMKDDVLVENSFKGWTYLAGIRVYL
jgi:phosphate-selective porin OprO/OprP